MELLSTIRDLFLSLGFIERVIVTVGALLTVAATLAVIQERRRQRRAGRKTAPRKQDGPRALEPPNDGTGHDWWEQWMLSVRASQEQTPGPDGSSIPVSKHLFLGSASAINFKWGRRATPTEYWAGGGIKNWGYQKYRDWQIEGPYPLYLHEDLLKEHCYLVGPTGTGKSSLGIMPLLIQIIHGHAQPGAARRSPLQPIVILDLKGDAALFHTVKQEVQREGLQQFKFFNLEKNAATYRFNPFRGFNPELRSLSQLCQMILDALALNHGKGYGRSYYTERSRAALSKALRANPSIASFHQLRQTIDHILQNERDKQARADAFELISVIETLGDYRQLITGPEDELGNRESIIYMPDVLRERQVVYFWLPAALESISAGEIAKLILFNLRAAAQDHKRLHPDDPVQTVLVIDELQRCAGENLAGILQDARSFGIGAILANQSLQDLRSPTGFDLGPTILTNTCVKFFFTSPHKGDYYVFVERGLGLTKARQYPLPGNPWLRDLALQDFAYAVTSSWPLSQETFDKRNRTPLPDWAAVPGGNPWTVAPPPKPTPAPITSTPLRPVPPPPPPVLAAPAAPTTKPVPKKPAPPSKPKEKKPAAPRPTPPTDGTRLKQIDQIQRLFQDPD